jgi:hypothetical protein
MVTAFHGSGDGIRTYVNLTGYKFSGLEPIMVRMISKAIFTFQ